MNRIAVTAALVSLLAATPAAFALQPSAIPIAGLRMMVSAGNVEIDSAAGFGDRYDAADNDGQTVIDKLRQSGD